MIFFSFFLGIKSFQNNEPFVNSEESLNKYNKVNGVFSFNFCLIFRALHTSIPHNKLLHILHEFIDFDLEKMKDEVTAIDRFGAKRVYNTTTKSFTFSESSSKSLVKYRINNSYFKFENKCCRQIIDIPIGSDAALFMANLFLHYYKIK